MFRLSLYTLLCLVVATTSFGQLTNGLVAHWNFNGNANDATGNGHNGTATNVTYAAGSQGTPGTAALFNGTNSFITVPYHSSFNLTSFTVCAKVKIHGYYTGTCQGNIIFQRGADFQSGHYTLQFSDNMFNSCQVSDTSKHCFYSHVRNKVPLNTTLQYQPTIVSGRWYCVISTFHDDTMRVYVDGVLKNTVQLSSGALGTSTDGISIGASRMGSYIAYPYWLNGLIDDLRLYNRALSQNEVDSFCNLFTSPITEPEVSISQPVSPTSFCPADNFVLHYTVTGPFNAGNIFTAQLSDATGSFATPVNIGAVTATGAGTINCTIPANTPQGTGYRVRVTASNPTKISADNGVNLTVFDAPKITLAGDTAVCIGDSLWFYAQVTPPAANINWTGPNGFSSTSNNIIIPNAGYDDTGLYIISVSNGGCIARDTIRAIVGNLDFELGDDTVICSGDTLMLAPGVQGAAYTWQDGSLSHTYPVAAAGQYHVEATLGSCVRSDTINVDMIHVAVRLPGDTVLCRDQQFSITVADTFDNYSWSTGSISPTITITQGGTYWLTVSKGKCLATDEIIVQQLEPYFILGNDTTLCNGRTLTLRPGTLDSSSYLWQDGSTKEFFIVKEKGLYNVTVTNICGSFGSNIQVDYIQCECTPIMPNAFTPDKNGLNDDIAPILTCIPASYKFIIANRWGEIVFETDDYKKRWDGKHYRVPAEMGTYFYFIQITDMLGNKSSHKGDILLLR